MQNYSDKYVGKILDRRYRLTRVLGVGGMSVVFEADDIVMNRRVAIKILKDEMAKDEVAVRRFVNESKALSMLSHPNIVKIYDVSVKGPLKYIIMERIEGITLKSYMQRQGALSVDEVLSYASQILKALSHVHEKGIIHRDIKPQNIMLLRNGKIKLTDFGIAKLPDASRDPEAASGKAIGTVYYISPEQAGSKAADTRSDLYSVGVLMYEMASGALPFTGETPVKVAMMQITDKPKPPSLIVPSIPIGLEQIILGAMEKNPERRFQSAGQMLKYVDRLRMNPEYVFKTRSSGMGDRKSRMKEEEMKKKAKKKKQSSSMFPIILGVTIGFGIVMLIGALYLIDMVMQQETENTTTTVEVPYAIGSVYDAEEISRIFDPSIYTVTVKTEYNASVAENTIISQEPAPGERRKVKKNLQYCEIILTVSKGAQTLYVPDYAMNEYRTARLAAEKLGFRCELRGVVSESVDIGYVLYTEPAYGTHVESGSRLIIYYSIGSTSTQITVPNLVNLTPAEATVKMQDNLTVGTVTYDYSPDIPSGKIMSQSLAAGIKAVKGSAINVVISLGVDPATTTTAPPVTDPPRGGVTDYCSVIP